jgi:ATP-dependent Lhr-like helicase
MALMPEFHPTVAQWFAERLGAPTPPQAQGWPAIRSGQHVLIAAPTGSGKTLAAFLVALDRLLRQGAALPDQLQVVYVSPLRALANDVQKNLTEPLAELQARDPHLPSIRVAVRSGDTKAAARSAMLRQPPHILVTTPESLYLLLTSVRGRALLASTRTLITDEIHALAGSKRGSHYALSCERLTALVTAAGGSLQRIGLSATQRPIAAIARLLAGAQRPCHIVDIGHQRRLDLAVELPDAPLGTVCSGELWQEIFARIETLIRDHRTTLVFVNTRKLAERVAARLADRLGKDRVTCHHGSLAKARRLDAEQRLKHGQLQALVATNSLELGIDIGDIDLVVQIGPTPTISALLQRIGRAGHSLARLPKGRLFPLVRDELVACAGLLHAVRHGQLDQIHLPVAPLDILAQQLVAIAADETLPAAALWDYVRGAEPYRELRREQFDAVLALHSQGRLALLHLDPVHGIVRGTRRARLQALTGGGAIPEVADWQVVQDHDDSLVGTVHEDFAIESSVGDVFQLGSVSWQIRRIGSGQLRVADAGGVPPSLPFWIAEGPSRSAELCAAVSLVRQHGDEPGWLERECGLGPSASEQLRAYLLAGRAALGAMPTADCLVLERFFDETGGQQLVLHCPLGSRLNRAFGLALRKRFCTGFGYELQAAANEEALLLSLGPMHSFALAEVWRYLHPQSVLAVLVQALLPAPMFQTRWRWNITRALLVERARGGRKLPAPLQRFRADDALAAAFPQAQACPETLPPGPIPVPMEHPIVRQTVADCLTEAMDAEGLQALLQRLQAGALQLVAIDRSSPSPLADGILHAMPYAFLDDAPLEERRTQAVIRSQRGARPHDTDAELDPQVLARVREESWPDPRSAEELHEVLGWIGWLEATEIAPAWRPWLDQLQASGRADCVGDRWYAGGSSRELLAGWRGRLEAVLPIDPDRLTAADRECLATLEAEGLALRARCQGRELVGHRRLLARVRRAMIEQLRAAIRPCSPADYAAFLEVWQGQADGARRSGPAGLVETLRQLATAAYTAEEWEQQVLPARIDGYQRSWLDQVTLNGEFVWLRWWGSFRGPTSRCAVSLLPRDELALWCSWPSPRPDPQQLGAAARTVHGVLQQHGALFPTDLAARDGLLPSHREQALAELVGAGLATCDSFAALRQLTIPPSQRRLPLAAVGRWSLLDWPAAATGRSDAAVNLAARSLLHRFGVLSHTLLLAQRVPLPWRELLRELRQLELRGELRGGRFVSGWSGEQYALPAAVAALRQATAARTAEFSLRTTPS